jgi:hypothetical protein
LALLHPTVGKLRDTQGNGNRTFVLQRRLRLARLDYPVRPQGLLKLRQVSPQPTANHPVAAAATIATASPLAGAISLLGVLAAAAYVAWRFGPTIARTTGWCSWWVAWACGSQGGYGYCTAFVIFGTLAWGAGTVWYARRRGYWPSALSAKLLTRVLRQRGPLTRM